MEAKVQARPVVRVQMPPQATESPSSALPAVERELKLTARDVNLWYGEKQALFDVNPRYLRPFGNGADRSVRLRQVNLPALRSIA